MIRCSSAPRLGPKVLNPGRRSRDVIQFEDFVPWSAELLGLKDGSNMTSANVKKRIFTAVNEALPGPGTGIVARIDIQDGWGDTTYVRIHTPLSRTATGQDLWASVRAAIDKELADRRHQVEILWNFPGQGSWTGWS